METNGHKNTCTVKNNIRSVYMTHQLRNRILCSRDDMLCVKCIVTEFMRNKEATLSLNIDVLH